MKDTMKIITTIIPVIIAIGLILTAADRSFAVVDTPTISNVSESTTTISGSGFGVGGTTNITWDNFEDGAVNTTATVGTWGSVNALGASSQSRHSNSHYAAHHNFTRDATAGVRGINSVLGQKWFIQYWVKLDSFDWGTGLYGSNSQHLSNIKFLRLWNPGSITENFYTAFDWSLNGNSVSYPENVQGATMNYYDSPFSKSSLSDNQWHLLQFEFIDSSSPGSADAVFKVWHNGQLVENRTGFVGRTTSDLKRPFFIGFYSAWGPNTALGETTREPNDYYMDDVYAAPTLARVELGNASTYDACTHREIQVPSAWSDTSITITPDKGSFSDSDNAYLFVVNADGVPSAGYELTGGNPGDVNDDGVVNVLDLIRVAKDFGKVSGFNPSSDIDGNGRVDVRDLILVARNFGR